MSLVSFSDTYWEIIDDLFARLPIRDLLFGCRGACQEWKQRISETRRGQIILKRRANLLHAIFKQSPIHKVAYNHLFAPDATSESEAINTSEIDLSTFEPDQQCLNFIWLLHKHWHEQLVLQSYRRACLAKLADAKTFYESKIEKTSTDQQPIGAENSRTNPTFSIHEESQSQVLDRDRQFLQYFEEAASGLQARVLEDENDLTIERASNQRHAETEQ